MAEMAMEGATQGESVSHGEPKMTLLRDVEVEPEVGIEVVL